MYIDFGWAVIYAFWFGILTAISPCPMATNIAAISFVSRKIDNPLKALLEGILYTAGRATAYTALGILIAFSLLNTPYLAFFLQKYMNMFLGPLLIIVGMILLELISFNIFQGGLTQKLHEKFKMMGSLGTLLLGMLFALSFCPTSAALFFGSLLPLTVKFNSSIVLPLTYGIATGLPVLIFAGVIAVGVNKIARIYEKVTSFERKARLLTGIIFIAVGIYYTFTVIFGVNFYK